jgi:hypothetical protein
MYFPQKVFYGVFELPLLRNAQKRHKKKKKKKKVPTYPSLSSARYTSLSILFFFGAPRAQSPEASRCCPAPPRAPPPPSVRTRSSRGRRQTARRGSLSYRIQHPAATNYFLAVLCLQVLEVSNPKSHMSSTTPGCCCCYCLWAMGLLLGPQPPACALFRAQKVTQRSFDVSFVTFPN